MKVAITSLVFATAAAVVQGQCHANNCARAVTGTNAKPSASIRRADCSSFFQITVTPDTYTHTVWETVTDTITPATETLTLITATVTDYNTVATETITLTPEAPGKRAAKRAAKRALDARAITVSPSVVPAYATPCAGPSAYSSACSCWGVTHVTITVATPTVSVTSTETATATVTETVTEYDATTTTVATTATVTQTCPSGPFYAECAGGCKKIKDDYENCGACGNVCSTGVCVNGVCSSTSESCPVTHNCQGGGNLYPACEKRPAYPSSPFCLCFEGYDGSRWCTDSASRSCGAVPLCETHDDCGMYNICVHHGCCHGGAKICRPVGAAICLESNTPARIFRHRSRRNPTASDPSESPDGETELGYVGLP